jgi:predicted dehydrogenase
MKFIVVGLGSMGKRRIRCLKKLGYNEIYGYDIREDRKKESEKLYGIQSLDNLDNIQTLGIEAAIISTPPDRHLQYVELFAPLHIPCFVEASVILEHSLKIKELFEKYSVFIAPSCTLKFHPAINDIKNIVNSGEFGKVTNFTYHCGQYLPDWHPWEDIKDYYVSNKETGASREIVPFELVWITEILGYPTEVKSFKGEVMNFGIDDVYTICFNFNNNYYGNMLVDVVSRFATRSLILNMEYGQIRWNWEESMVKLYDAKKQRWLYFNQPYSEAHEGYNKNIIEQMYVDEIKAFLEGLEDPKKYPYSIDEDVNILQLLSKIENFS